MRPLTSPGRTGAPDVTVRIDRIAIDIGADRHAEQAAETVRQALALLAARLTQAPLGLGVRAPELALRLLDLGPVDPEWLAGPGAAQRLSERLYRSLVEGAVGGTMGGGDGRR